MIVTAMTGEYDDARIYTAAELAGDWWWNELGYEAVYAGGRMRYETVAWPERASKNVRVGRIALSPSGKPYPIYRYISPDTKMRLVKTAPTPPPSS